MKLLAASAAAVGALIVFAACSQTPSTTTGTRHVTDTRRAVLVNCPKEYAAWKQGPARKLVGAVNAVDSANSAGDIRALEAALRQAGLAVNHAGRYPMPACADPKGFWTALLMHVNAAASTKSSGSGTASITLALKGVPTIERELSGELKNTAGVR
jgi:hypothetical protein